MTNRQETIEQDSLWTQYSKIRFGCIDCDSSVTVKPDETECHSCGRQYDVEIDVTAGEKNERKGWPPDE